MINMKQFPISYIEWILINCTSYREEQTKNMMFYAILRGIVCVDL